MTDKEFLKKIAHEKGDFLQSFIDLLRKEKISFCIIGGLGVNAYAKPVVSLGACRSNAFCCEKRYTACDRVRLAKSPQRSAVTTLPGFLLVFLVSARISFFSRRNPFSDRLLDLDVIVVSEKIELLVSKLKKTCKIKTFPNSINLSTKKSDLRIQIRTDSRYQPFLKRASRKNVLGYPLPVASIEDIFQGKLWAVQDKTRRVSKRQKDLADVARLIEAKRELMQVLPDSLRIKLRM